jgi:hypothetical protein
MTKIEAAAAAREVTLPAQSGFPNANRIHYEFCATREAGKRVRITAALAEGGAVLLALWRLLADREFGWMPLTLLLLTLIDVTLRAVVEDLRGYAQRYRRASVRAYADGRDLDTSTTARLRFDLPWMVRMLTPGYKSLSLEAYYDTPEIPLPPPGEQRLRVLSAHSAFFTSRLNRVYFWFLAGLTLLATLVSIVIVYDLAMDTTTQPKVRVIALDVLCTVVLVYFALRAMETAIRAARASARTKGILRAMSGLPLPTGRLLQELVDEYDFERSSDPDVPTLLYSRLNLRIDQEWAAVIGAFEEAPDPKSDHQAPA